MFSILSSTSYQIVIHPTLLLLVIQLCVAWTRPVIRCIGPWEARLSRSRRDVAVASFSRSISDWSMESDWKIDTDVRDPMSSCLGAHFYHRVYLGRRCYGVLSWVYIIHISKSMHTVCALLCFVGVDHWLSSLIAFRVVSRTLGQPCDCAPVPVKRTQMMQYIPRDPQEFRASSYHDNVIKWTHFLRNWPFVRGIHQSPVNSPHKASDAELCWVLWSASE